MDIVEDPFPIVDMPIEVKFAGRPKRVYLAPAGTDLAFAWEGGYVRTRVTILDGHAMLVIEE